MKAQRTQTLNLVIQTFVFFVNNHKELCGKRFCLLIQPQSVKQIYYSFTQRMEKALPFVDESEIIGTLL